MLPGYRFFLKFFSGIILIIKMSDLIAKGYLTPKDMSDFLEA
jgi:hypothetical protein